MSNSRKKLIGVALPLEAINKVHGAEEVDPARASDFGVTSANYNFSEHLARAEPPR
jgi:hypothetical protein